VTEIHLLPFETDPAAVRHGDGRIVERIPILNSAGQTSLGTRVIVRAVTPLFPYPQLALLRR
jgi:hypothetical protein